MTVVTQIEDNCYIYCKGADHILKNLCHNQEIESVMEDKINEYCNQSWRVIAYADKVISYNEYKEWSEKYEIARSDPLQISKYKQNISNDISNLELELESHLFFRGIVGLEDILQEEVPETIQLLKSAGVKICILTGDKVETAKNIAKSCGLIDETDNYHMLDFTEDSLYSMVSSGKLNKPLKTLPCTTFDEIKEVQNTKEISNAAHEMLETLELIYQELPLMYNMLTNEIDVINENKDLKLYIIIDEKCLDYLLLKCPMQFLSVCTFCQCIIACRTRKDQKGLFVKLMTDNIKKGTTLAIGDGANDVEMLQNANLGVAIIGREGTQAVNRADVAISRFKYLAPLLIFHGRNNYKRISQLILYIIFKNLLLTMPQYLFSFYTGASGQKFYPEWGFQLFNTIYTAAPIVYLAIMDSDIQEKTLYHYSYVYKRSQNNQYLTHKAFFLTLLSGFYYSFTALFVSIYAYSSVSQYISGNISLWDLGTFVYTVLIIITNLKLLYEIRKYTKLFVTLWILGIGLWILTILIISFQYRAIFESPDLYQFLFRLPKGSLFWLITLLIVLAILLKEYIYKFFRRQFFPHPEQIVAEREILNLCSTDNSSEVDQILESEIKINSIKLNSFNPDITSNERKKSQMNRSVVIGNIDDLME